MGDNEVMADLDPKTKAVFKKKGYYLEKKLSQGSFGQVYKAKNTKTDETVAVKVMDLEKVGEKFKEKFLPENWQHLLVLNMKMRAIYSI